MKPHQFPLAGFTLIAFVAMLPVWVWFVHSSPATAEMGFATKFAADLSLPAVAAMFVVSWSGGT